MAGSLLSFETAQYETHQTSSFIYEPVWDDDGGLRDFRVVYASDIFARDWQEIYHNDRYLGALLRGSTLMDEYSLHMMERFLTEKPFPFVTYMPLVNLHLYFEPMEGLPAPYAGFYLTNITDYASRDAKDHFLRNIRQMKNNAVLLRQHGGGRLEPVFVSEEFAEMMECSVGEAMELMDGMGAYRTTHPEDRPLVRSMLAHRVTFDGGSVLTIQKITAKQNRIWCTIHYSFIDDFNEHYVYCTYTDVTALKAHEERLRSVYSNMGASFYQAGERTLANLRVNLTRNSFEEIQGRDLFDTDNVSLSYTDAIRRRAEHYPIRSERSRFLELFDRENMRAGYLTGTARISQVLYSRRRDGHVCFVRFSASITRHPLSGDLVAFLTEQECNSEKVRETLMDKILAQQFDMVAYLVDGQYGVTIGEAAKIKHGSIFPTLRQGSYDAYLRTQVVPVLSGPEEQRREMARALSMKAVTAALRVREPYVVNISIEMNGETYYKQFNFFSIDPEADFYILLKTDTTMLQKEQIAKNEQLREALEAANQANVAKTAFLSSMSHEIRTPMNAIIGLDNIALSDPDLPPRTREQLEKIGASARHLLGLINDVLDMSRIESGRMTLRQEEFSFSGMLEQINTMIHSQCTERGLRYEFRVSGAVDERYIGDDMKLKQVIINILGNSVKFTPAPGTVRFSVVKTAEFDGQSTLRFQMQDTGIGMDKAFLPKLFEAFSQEDDSSTNRYGSTGLGMAITKNIVEMMNGSISVDSEKGVGTTFTVNVTLRNCARREAAPEAPAEEGAPPRSEEELAGILAGRRVLLAEDMAINAEIMIELLHMMDMTADHAENGQEAVARFTSHPEGWYDAVLMDMRMPVLDGLGAARAIRASGRADSAAIPIIALTANAFDEDVQRSLQAGMNAHLSKPVEPERLFETLGRLITRAQ